MKPSRHEDTGTGERSHCRQSSADDPGKVQPQSSQARVQYQQQHEFAAKQHHEGSKVEHTSSSPPQSVTTTTGTTTTPTSLATDVSSPPTLSPEASSEAKEAIASSIGPNFPHHSPPSAPDTHRLPSHTPVHGEGSDEAQWDHPSRVQHPTSTRHTVGVDPSYAKGEGGEESSFPSAIKMLVSNNMAGSIIGRSGQTISDLQAQSSTRIKLSQTGDYFPGTQDRVCLVQGQAENVKKAMSLLLSRLYALQQQNHLQHVALQQGPYHPSATPDHFLGTSESLQPPGVNFVVRILVPSPSCGMIIGKGGSNIKQMVDASGVSSVRLSPKEGYTTSTDSFGNSESLASATSERVVTVTGPDLNSCITCSFIILDGMTLHPDICRYANMTTSYSRVKSAVHAYDAAAATAAVHPGMPLPSQESIPMGMAPSLWDFGYVQSPHHDPGLDLVGSFDTAPISPSIYHISLSGQPGLQTGFASSPSSPHFFRGQEGVPPYSPMFGGPASFTQSSPDAGAYQPSPLRGPMPRSHSNTCLQFGQPLMGVDAPRATPPSASAPDLLALQFQETLRMSDSRRFLSDLSTAQYAHGHGGNLPQQNIYTAQVAIPDSLIGSILGRGGLTLNELQTQSNTRIRISQRGEYVPGTRNRIVTIRGPTAQSVTMAQLLMSERMVLPPTAVSPTTAFPIQPVYGQQQQQGSSYRTSSGDIMPHSHDDSRQADPRASPHIHPPS